jgi:hypothetical protein
MLFVQLFCATAALNTWSVVSSVLRPQPLAVKFIWDVLMPMTEGAVLSQGIPTQRLARALQFICYILGVQFKYTVHAYNQFTVQKQVLECSCEQETLFSY